MFCTKCGSACLPEHKFCKSCGAPLGVASIVQQTAPATATPTFQTNGGAQAIPSAAYPNVPPSVPPPGMPLPGVAPPLYASPGAQPVMYPAAGQPVYYVAVPGAHPHPQQVNLLESLRSRIRGLASTESLEGFSLKEMFSDVFKRRGTDDVENYVMVGTPKTTPPIELVETGWPKPWLFFRLLVALVIACAAMIFMYMETNASNCVPGIMFLGAFAVPLATLVLLFELNTPRNVSIHVIGKLFLMGAMISLGMAIFVEILPVFSKSAMYAGPIEETAKLLAVVLVVRSTRYKYILNGILFGATVGAGFAAFETSGYGLGSFLPAFWQGIVHYQHVFLQNGQPLSPGQIVQLATHDASIPMMLELGLRGIEAPLGHVAWTALAAGAFWRVKGSRATNVSMLLDVSFLKAFAIPVVMHAIWDAPWQLPFQGNQILTGLVTWYVVFGLVQQGLRQVKEEQRTHLQSTLANVEAAMATPSVGTA
jgi:protease PrsW